VQNINCVIKANGINGTVSVRIEVLDHLKYTSTSKPLQRLYFGML
jgi:hypothetical protein